MFSLAQRFSVSAPDDYTIVRTGIRTPKYWGSGLENRSLRDKTAYGTDEEVVFQLALQTVFLDMVGERSRNLS
jgi:hypothetical protein